MPRQLLIVSDAGDIPEIAAPEGWTAAPMGRPAAAAALAEDADGRIGAVLALGRHEPESLQRLHAVAAGRPLLLATPDRDRAGTRTAALRAGAVACLDVPPDSAELAALLARHGTGGAARADTQSQPGDPLLRNLCDSAAVMLGIVELEPDNPDILHAYHNAAASRFFGREPGGTAGRTARELGASEDGARLWIEQCRAAETAGRPEDFEARFEVNGAEARMRVSVSLIGPDGRGRIRFAFVARDASGDRRAALEKAEREERLAAALRAGRLGIYDYDVATGRLCWDRTLREIWGLSEDETPDAAMFEAGLHPEDRARVLAIVEHALTHGTASGYAAEYRITPRNGAGERWIHAEGEVIFEKGVPRRLVGTAQDITARKRIEEQLLAQQRLYRSITDNASLALFILDERQRCVFMNPAAEALTGFSLAEIEGRRLHDHIHHTRPDGSRYPLSECPIVRALPRNDRESGEEVFVHKDGHFYDVRFTASPIRDATGTPTGTVLEVEDITERRRAERQIELLMREVNHRSKNMLAVVQAMANQSARRSDPATFATAFIERLHSLSASHDLLVNNNWHGVDLQDLAASQLIHFAGIPKRRIGFGGPDIRLAPAAAQAIGMALHELGTNAVKHGALSEPGGTVNLSWNVRPAAAGPDFHMLWVERGGPPVVPPLRKGFGSRLIVEMTELSIEGRAELRYPPEGLEWEVTAPLERLTR